MFFRTMPLQGDSALEFLRLSRRFQQRNQFVLGSRELQLSPAEIHVMVELSGATEPWSFSGLMTSLQANQSALSKLLASLVRRRLLRRSSRIAANSGRAESVFQLTSLGTQVLGRYDQVAENLYASFASELSSEELARLGSYLSQIADGMGAPASVVRDGEFVLRSTIRRLTRVLELLGKVVSGGDFSILEWQIISHLSTFTGAPSLLQLSILFNAPHNTVSQAVQRLKKRRLLDVQLDSTDARSRLVEVSNLGRSRFLDLEERMRERLSLAFAKLSNSSVLDGQELLRRFVHLLPEEHGIYLGAGRKVVWLFSKDRRIEARASVLEYLVREGNARLAPALIIGQASQVFTFVEKGKDLAIIEMVSVPIPSGLEFKINSVSLVPGHAPQACLPALLRAAVELLETSMRNVSCGLEFSSWPVSACLQSELSSASSTKKA